MTAQALAFDQFNRSNGALGSNWDDIDSIGSQITVNSNAAAWVIGSTGAGFARYKSSVTAFAADQISSCIYHSAGTITDSGPGPAVRINAGTSWGGGSPVAGYFLQGTSTELRCYYGNSSGSFTQLGADMAAPADGDRLTLAIIGTTLYCFVNGIQVGTRTDSNLASGQPGLWFSASASVTVDDWYAQDVMGGQASDITVDSFTRSDGPLGANYTDVFGTTFAISSNKAIAGTGSDCCVAYTGTAPSSAQMWVQATLGEVTALDNFSGGSGPGLAARVDLSENLYWFTFTSAYISLSRVAHASSSFTSFWAVGSGGVAAAPFTITNNSITRMEVRDLWSGNVLVNVYIGGVPVILSAIDNSSYGGSPITSKNYAGLLYSSTLTNAGQYDDFSFGALDASAPAASGGLLLQGVGS